MQKNYNIYYTDTENNQLNQLLKYVSNEENIKDIKNIF